MVSTETEIGFIKLYTLFIRLILCFFPKNNDIIRIGRFLIPNLFVALHLLNALILVLYIEIGAAYTEKIAVISVSLLFFDSKS